MMTLKNGWKLKIMSNTNKISNELLSSFSSNGILSKAVGTKKLDDMFNPHREEFKTHKLNIPWYLWLFKKVIEDIAYKAFCAAKPVDTITFKRPNTFKVNKND